MITNGRIRTLSGLLLFGLRTGREDWETTDRWRDKRAQGALRSGGCFCSGISSQTHIAPQIGNVRQVIKPLHSFAFLHLVSVRYGR
ncbi:hypothetical protein [Xanthobacter sediminis]|uniref:hypothetical protein n=1 Tax=Xanthobacter sediminis TaxID=3119926 RepID=UPI00372624BA